MVCPKCQYQRQAADDAPDWQCPRCGIAYAKAGAVNAAGIKVAAAARPIAAATNSGFSFKNLRIFILLVILAVVALDSWLSIVRSTDWQDSLWVVVYPVNADASQASADYIKTLSSAEFAPVQDFFAAETARYGIDLKDPVEIRLGPVVAEMPPLPPADRSILKTIWWSLQLRYWSATVDKYAGPRSDIRVFVLFHQPEQNKRMQHSTGLQKGMVSVVQAFAGDKSAQQNNFVIAHELLHTLGATDKYDFQSLMPVYPEGYAEPTLEPLLPQKLAEIMGGRVAISATQAVMPESLSQVLVGEKTAAEIGWRSIK